MTDPFVHLHVASGYSLRHGASHPPLLVQRAADHGMDTLALTDRDGVYGAVRFAKACRSAGIRPILGTDLAVTPVALDRGSSWPAAAAPHVDRRTPARGGAFVDQLLPRVTLLAEGRRGWASLCRLISAVHLAGERGEPIATLELIAAHAEGLVILLGPASELGVALARRRPDVARAHLNAWQVALAAAGADVGGVSTQLVIEVVHHRAAGEVHRAKRLLSFATEERIPVVLTNQVRYADSADAPVADVLDASRRLVALDSRHVDRANAEGYLKSGKEMAEIAEELTGDHAEATRLLARTRALAERCVLDVAADLGIGTVHFPELETSSWGATDRRRGPGAADAVLRERCLAGMGRRSFTPTGAVLERLDDELGVIGQLGFPTYFLTVADVVGLIKGMGVRAAARGSGAGSLVTYLLGISDIDPMRHGLLMERFLSPLRHQLPDIDIDVESARRMEVYTEVLAKYGGERCACVAMMDTYRARHAIRDVGGALGMPPGEIDAVAKAFPHIRASQVRAALRDLPELRASGISAERLDVLFRMVERLDGLPRHIALHPCGVLLSDATLLDRTPVEASFLGFPMSQFDKDDVEDLGLLKLDLLGIRMQSAIRHTIDEVVRVTGKPVDIDNIAFDDPKTFDLIRSTRTLGCFQIESPGQRELIGKFGPESFEDIIVDISLFRPGPVKSDMIRPFLEARQGWNPATFPHPDLEDALAETEGVVVFHEQVLKIIHIMTGCTLAEADEARRALGDPEGHAQVRRWFVPALLERGYDAPTVERVWEILKAFGSFGFCKAHAAAFALPTYQSAYLKAHHPAEFLSGVLTHDPGMYPKRLILDDARQLGIAILPLDVNTSDAAYRVEVIDRFAEPPPKILDQLDPGLHEPGGPDEGGAGEGDDPHELRRGPRPKPPPQLPDGRNRGIRIGLAEVKGINDAEVGRIVTGRPYGSLSDFWHRAAVSRPVAERLVVAGAFDEIYGIGRSAPVRRRGALTRRDLLLQVGELDHWARATVKAARRTGVGSTKRRALDQGPLPDLGDTAARAARQSQATQPVAPVSTQLTLDLGDAPGDTAPSGLPEMTDAELVRAELDVLGLDATRHVVDFYEPFLRAAGITRARDLLGCRSGQQVLVAGVKVATQTPPIRSGRRVVFVTLDDATGPLDATFFEDAQAGYASTIFHSWLLVIKGQVRRTGPRGVSLLGQGCWELPLLAETWSTEGLDAVADLLTRPAGWDSASEAAVAGAAESRSPRPVKIAPPGPGQVFTTGFRKSDYVDIKPSGGDAKSAPRKLWHSSSGKQWWVSVADARKGAVGMNILLDVPDTRADVSPAGSDLTATGATSLVGTFAGPGVRPDAHRANLRTALVAEALDAALAELGPAPLQVLDAGGGTGGLAVPLAAAGHHVTVVDPSPDSLAALERRAAETHVSERITAIQGDLDDLSRLFPAASMQVVLFHGVLEVVDDRISALAAVTATLTPGGLLSVLTANRLALVLHRSLAGRFNDAAAALTPTATGPVDFTELTGLLAGAGLEVRSARGVRTVSDLVPGALLDSDPRATAMLLELERKAGDDTTLRAIATQLHVLCRRRA